MSFPQLMTVASVVGFSTRVLNTYMTHQVKNEHCAIFAEPPQTSIILPTLNEEFFIEKTLISLKNQNILRKFPDRFELLICDSHSVDATAEIASSYGKVLLVPKGKLTARDIGIKKAKGEIIVSVDADSIYYPNWLNLMIRHFQDLNVVAVSSPRISDGNPIRHMGYIWKCLLDFKNRRMLGSNSAFRQINYLECGGFNLKIDQLNRIEMVREEEYEFTPRLLSHGGRYVFDFQASIFTSPRYWSCPFTKKTTECSGVCEYCRQRKEKERF